MIRRSKPLKRVGLKPPTPEQVQAWRGKPRTPIGRGAAPKKIGRRGRRLEASWQACRAAVISRSGGACEGPDLPGIHPSHAHGATDVHHLHPSDRAAGVHDPDRCLHLCRPLHSWIDLEPRKAHELGLLRPDGLGASQVVPESDSLWPW